MSDISPIFTFAQYAKCRIAFQMRLAGQADYWNVSGCTSITLGWEPHGGSPGIPLVANPTDPYANWAQGLVVFWIGPTDITASIATVDCVLVFNTADGQIIPSPIGAIEIVYQPGRA